MHKSHVPHVVAIVHMAPALSGSSSPHTHDTHQPDTSKSLPVAVPAPAPPPTLTQEQKQLAAVAANPKIAKYKDSIANMKPGDMMELPPINFVYNQDELAVANMESFMQAVEFANNGFMVLVEGHTDDRGSDDYNLKLSMKRVERIKQLMVEMGVSEDFISVVGQGERKPIVPNTSEENRLKNRRIEFKIFKL
jgi:outer membrane protein OmpA-like peptidoglycan-associated protein